MVVLASVYERRREIFTLASVGLNPTHIFMVFLSEAFLLGFVGGSLGYILSFGILKLMQVAGIVVPVDVKTSTLFEYLALLGRRCVVIGLPLSYPPKGLFNGIMFSDFLYPRISVFPSSKSHYLKRSGYKPVADTTKRGISLIGEALETLRRRLDLAKTLLLEEEWDFFMVVFMMLDRIQHFFWRFVDPSHPNYEEGRLSGLVKEAYLRMDRIVRDFLHVIDEETMVMVLSDHGFCPVHKEVFINNYLEELGLLRISRGQIDLKRSKAVSYGYGDIWLNVRGREPHGIVNPGAEYEELRSQIIDELRKIAVDGEAPIKDIKRREEIYWGPHLHTAPDLITIFNVGWQAARNPEFVEKTPSRRYVNDHPRWSGGHDGTHDPSDVPGFLAIYHPELQPRIGVRVPLWSLAPTILALMDIPIPVDMDGKPLLGGV